MQKAIFVLCILAVLLGINTWVGSREAAAYSIFPIGGDMEAVACQVSGTASSGGIVVSTQSCGRLGARSVFECAFACSIWASEFGGNVSGRIIPN